MDVTPAGTVYVPVAVIEVQVFVPAGSANASETQLVPLEVKTLPSAPGATTCSALVPLPSKTLLAVSVVAPVPPLATGRVPVTAVARLMFVSVLLEPLIVLLVSV